ncbi:MAG: hypothetical protein QXG98_01635 [Candidatus Micrarchaeia archaeon]
MMRALAVLALVSSLALAIAPGEVNILYPVFKTVRSGDNVTLGIIGPGQTISLTADALVTEGGIFGQGGRWDQLVITEAPPGWTWSDSLIYEQPLRAKITADPSASDGLYVIRAAVVDFGDKEKIGGNVSFDVLVKVSRNVVGIEVAPLVVTTGAGQPAGYYVTVRNNGTANDVFEVTSSGVPLWEFRRDVFVPAGGERTVIYEVVSEEERELSIVLRARSRSSPLIFDEKSARLVVRTDLIGDWRATGHGNLLFPLVEGPIYGLVGLLANFL